MMDNKSTVDDLGFCLSCGQPIQGEVTEVLKLDPEGLTAMLAHCKECRSQSRSFLRVPETPRYQCHYMSTQGEETAEPFNLDADTIHFCVTAEIYETFFPDPWNGFKQVCKATDIPPLYTVSMPHSHFRQGIVVDVVLLITSFVASGVIGGVAHDVVRDKGRKLWGKFSARQKRKVKTLIKEAPHQEGDDFSRVFHSAFTYLHRRLAGLEALCGPDGFLYKAAKHLAEREDGAISSRELADLLNCSIDDSKYVLKRIGARYSMSSKKWELPQRLLRYYRGEELEVEISEEVDSPPFYAQGRPSREVAWRLDIPTLPGLSDDEEMEFEIAVLQATTPDTEAFLRGEISDQELQQRVYIKAGALTKSHEKRDGKKKSQ
jgi:hypothetical protein